MSMCCCRSHPSVLTPPTAAPHVSRQACYNGAQRQRQQRQPQQQAQQQQQQQGQQQQQSASQPVEVGTGRIRFPWRIAAKFLLDMKRKAPELLAHRASQRQLAHTT